MYPARSLSVRLWRIASGRKRLMICAVFLFAGMLLCAWALLQPRELHWRGKPARHWIGSLNHMDSTGHSSAEEFLFAAGPGVIPELERGLHLRDAFLNDLWTDIYFKKLGKRQRHFSRPIKREHYRANAARALGLLGSAASNTVPALLRALNDESIWVQTAAAGSLSRIAPADETVFTKLVEGSASTNSQYQLASVIGLTHCTPLDRRWGEAIRRALQSNDSNIRAWAAGAAWRDTFDRPKMFKTLLAAVQDEQGNVRSRAAESLGKMRFLPEVTVPALTNALAAEKNDVLIWKIVESIGNLGTNAAPAAGTLKMLSASTNHTAILSLVALSRIEPGAEWVEQIIESLTNSIDGHAFWAAWELGRRGEAARKAVPALLQAADDAQDWRTEIMARAAAWRLDATCSPPFTEISKHLDKERNGYYEIIRLLEEIGPAAKETVPALRRLRYGRGSMAHDYAHAALNAIAPDYSADPWKE